MSSVNKFLSILLILYSSRLVAMMMMMTKMDDDMIEQVKVQEGSEVKLRCTHYGNPTSNVYWIFKTIGKIKSFTAYNYQHETDLELFDSVKEGVLKFRRTDHILSIDCVTKRLQGLIMCSHKKSLQQDFAVAFNLSIAENGRNTSSKQICSKDVYDNYQPSIHLHTLSIIDHEGDDAILQCRSHGDPRPHIKWFDPKGRKVKYNQKAYQLFPNGDLLIRKLSWKRDKGNYICFAINKYGNDSSETFVYPAETRK